MSALLAVLYVPLSTPAQGTAFVYQGKLAATGTAADGCYDFRFVLSDAEAGGGQVGPALTNTAVRVSGGLFTVALDFGANFPGAGRWLEIAVRTNGPGVFTTLSPRQKLTATPYAVTAGQLSGTLPASQLAGTLPGANLGGTYSGGVVFNNAANSFTGNGAGLTGLNAEQLSSGTVADARLAANVARTNQVWLLGGNAETTAGAQFLGTRDNQPLELKVSQSRALRLEPGTNGIPNLIGGAWVNEVAAGTVGATIGGGGAYRYGGDAATNSVAANFGTVSGGKHNRIAAGSVNAAIGGGHGNSIKETSASATIGGGYVNRIWSSASSSTIGGGMFNEIHWLANDATIGGGFENIVYTNADAATISGGESHRLGSEAKHATIGGGLKNSVGAASQAATVSGGAQNQIGTNSLYATIAGGLSNQVLQAATAATIAGGSFNRVASNAVTATIAGGSFNEIAPRTTGATISGGHFNSISPGPLYPTISGGLHNLVVANGATISGGSWNWIESGADGATIAGGGPNAISSNGLAAVIGGGQNNQVMEGAARAVIPGGSYNVVRAADSFAAGTSAQANHSGAFVWADPQPADFASQRTNEFAVRAAGGARFETSGAGLMVDGARVATQPVSAAQLAAGAVAAVHLADNAVTNPKLQNNAVTSAKVQDGTLTAADVNPESFNQTFWRTDGNSGTRAESHFVGTTDDQPLELRANARRALRLEPTRTPDAVNVVGGSALNFVGSGSVGATIAGGGTGNFRDEPFTNGVSANYGAIGGGLGNTIQADAESSVIAGGFRNSIRPQARVSVIGGGEGNVVQTNADGAVIGGGSGNTILGNADAATIPGGADNQAGGSYSFAAGRRAKANHAGSFVWGDSTDADVTSTRTNQFVIRALGGVRLTSGTTLSWDACALGLDGGGNIELGDSTSHGTPYMDFHYGVGTNQDYNVRLINDADRRLTCSGTLYATAFVPSSDRNAKENFAPVEPREVLAKVAALPISRWNFKESPNAEHVGPMAQDFHAAFGLGADDKHIATVDADGVALAAIQGLNQKLEARSQELEAENAELKARLARLEQMVRQLIR